MYNLIESKFMDFKSSKGFYLLFLAFFSLSCNKENNKNFITEDDFKEEIFLKSEPVKGIDQLMPALISIVDSMIVVTDYVENPRIHFYNKNSLEKIQKLGFIGEGPNEFSAPEWNGQILKDKDGSRFVYIYEFGYGIYHQIFLDDIFSDKISKKKEFYLPPEVMNALNVFFINDSLYGENTNSKDVKYFKTKIGDSQNFERLGKLNSEDILNRVPIEDRVNLDRSYTVKAKNNNLFVSGYLRFNKIVIQDQNFREIKVLIYGSKLKGPETADFTSRENVYYFRRPFGGKELFYVPYVGVANKETTAGTEIHVYDYSGNPLVKFLTDVPIIEITVDEEDSKIYIITGLDDNPIVSVNFPKIS